MNIAEPFVRQALAAPDRPAIVVGPESLSHGQLLSTMKQLAARLVAAGVGQHDRVALAVTTPGGNIALCLAVAYIGAVSVGIPGGMKRELIEELSEKFAVNFVVHNQAENFTSQYPAFKGQIRLDKLFGASGDFADPPMAHVEPEDAWRIVLSSGTTGRHKGILCPHRASVSIALLHRGVILTGPEDRLLIAMEPSMGFAMHYWLRALYSGACVFLPMDTTAHEALKVIHEKQITQLVTTTGTAMAMANRALQPGSPYSEPSPALRIANVGGAKVSPPLHDALRRHVCPSLHVNYGATETGPLALLDSAVRAKHPHSAGRLVPWVEAQAVDETGRPLPQGTVGTLRFRSPGLCLGYVGQAAAADEPGPFRDGWFHSNDIGSVSPEGVIFLSGRANDVINISGVKVDPEKLEAIIAEDPAILDCVVVDIPGKLGQPMLVAVVVASDEVDVEGLKHRCARLGRNCVPTTVLRARKLPRNDAGKVLRDEVRQNIRRSRQGAATTVAAAN